MVTSFFALNALFITGISLVSYKIFTDFTSREISEMRLALLNESTGKVSNFITSISDAGIYIVVNDSVIRTFSNRISSIYDAIVEQRELTELVQDMVSLKEGIHSIEIYTDRYRHYPEVSDNAVYPMDVLTSQPWSHLLENADNVWVPKHISAGYPAGSDQLCSPVDELSREHRRLCQGERFGGHFFCLYVG